MMSLNIEKTKKMKKFFTICAVVIASLAFNGLTVSAQDKAEFKFEQETHDFGKIAQGTPVTYTFKFTNTGTAPLIISNVQSTCGCTVPDYSKVPVKPGEEGLIKVTFNAAAAQPFSKPIIIASNAKTPSKTLIIKGEVIAK